jgi:hypothetical protein
MSCLATNIYDSAGAMQPYALVENHSRGDETFETLKPYVFPSL